MVNSIFYASICPHTFSWSPLTQEPWEGFVQITGEGFRKIPLWHSWENSPPHCCRQSRFPSWGTGAGLTEADIHPVGACSSRGSLCQAALTTNRAQPLQHPRADTGRGTQHGQLPMPGLPRGWNADKNDFHFFFLCKIPHIDKMWVWGRLTSRFDLGNSWALTY